MAGWSEGPGGAGCARRRRRTVATTDTLTVVGSFDDPARARATIDELLRAGFRHDQLGWIHKDFGAAGKPAVAGDTAPEEGAAAGAVAGGPLGRLPWAALAAAPPAARPRLAPP